MYDIFMHLCQKNDVSVYQVCRATGVPASTMSDWKSGKSIPKVDKLKAIADYFGVTIDYLVTGKETEHEPYYYNEESREIANFLFKNPQYATLFKSVRDVPPGDLQMVQSLLDRLIPKDENYGA